MLIVVTGCDGCGKSTAANALVSRMRIRGVRTQVIDTWALNDRELYPECRFLSPDVKQIKECGNEMRSPERALFLFWMIANAARQIERGDRSTLYIADSFWPKHIGNEVVRGFPEEAALALGALLPEPDITFLLRAPPALALRRKKSRITRFECGSDDLASEVGFLSFQTRLQAKLDQWGAARHWIAIDAAEDPQSMHRRMISRVESLLRQETSTSAGREDASPKVRAAV
jgi:thymidylate kinase